MGIPPLTLTTVAVDTVEYKALTIPGATTQALSPCRLEQVDIDLSASVGGGLQLVRSYNSFFNPRGLWEKGWTLDLPKLVEMTIPLERSSGKASYVLGYELITPLNSMSARFLNGLPVVGFATPKTPSVDNASPFLDMSDGQLEILQGAKTRLIRLKDGREWYFTSYGSIVAEKTGPHLTIFERGGAGQVTRIIGLYGERTFGDIRLEYDEHAILSSVILHPADSEDSAMSQWQETKLDRKGRPIMVADAAGLQVLIDYDKFGGLAGLVQQTPDGNFGYEIKRDEQGRVQKVSSSWGSTEYGFGSDGTLDAVVTTRGGQSALVELSDGLVRSRTGFDSSRTMFDYHRVGSIAGLPKSIVSANGLKMAYEYDSSDRPSVVQLGPDRKVRLEYNAQGRVVAYTWEPATQQ